MTPRDTDERILSAAATLFASHGYVGTTTSAIADEAGVNEVTLFRRFGTKEGILRALGAAFDRGGSAYPSDDAVVDGDVRATLRNLAVAEMRAAIESGGLVLRLSFDARSVPEVREALGDVASANLERLAAFLESAQQRGQVRDDIPANTLAEAFFALTSSLVIQRTAVIDPRTPTADAIERAAQTQLELLWSGLGPRKTHTPTGG
jgi:AcrR family transcriptional regulator